MVEVGVQRDQLVRAGIGERRFGVGAVPRPVVGRGRRIGDQPVGEFVVDGQAAGGEFVGDPFGTVDEEVVPEHGRRLRVERALVGHEVVERLHDLAGRLDEAAERDVGDVQESIAEAASRGLAVRFVAQVTPIPRRRRERVDAVTAGDVAVELVAVVVLVGDRRGVVETSHRDHVVAADEHDVRELVADRVDDRIDRGHDAVGGIGVARSAGRVPGRVGVAHALNAVDGDDRRVDPETGVRLEVRDQIVETLHDIGAARSPVELFEALLVHDEHRVRVGIGRRRTGRRRHAEGEVGRHAFGAHLGLVDLDLERRRVGRRGAVLSEHLDVVRAARKTVGEDQLVVGAGRVRDVDELHRRVDLVEAREVVERLGVGAGLIGVGDREQGSFVADRRQRVAGRRSVRVGPVPEREVEVFAEVRQFGGEDVVLGEFDLEHVDVVGRRQVREVDRVGHGRCRLDRGREVVRFQTLDDANGRDGRGLDVGAVHPGPGRQARVAELHRGLRLELDAVPVAGCRRVERPRDRVVADLRLEVDRDRGELGAQRSGARQVGRRRRELDADLHGAGGGRGQAEVGGERDGCERRLGELGDVDVGEVEPAERQVAREHERQQQVGEREALERARGVELGEELAHREGVEGRAVPEQREQEQVAQLDRVEIAEHEFSGRIGGDAEGEQHRLHGDEREDRVDVGERDGVVEREQVAERGVADRVEVAVGELECVDQGPQRRFDDRCAERPAGGRVDQRAEQVVEAHPVEGIDEHAEL